jgi:arginyl-tRNA synthetase
MNGKDGKPFKTRAGGILRLSDLIQMVEDNAKNKILANITDKGIDPITTDIDSISKIIGLATLKFADLSNFRMKDYVFDLDKFSSFEGKTGPYILYSTVRIKNIIRKLEDSHFEKGPILAPESQIERDMMLKLDAFEAALLLAARDRAPNVICEYVYDIATLVSSFYHAHHILNEEDQDRKKSWYSLLSVVLQTLETGLELLGISVPEKM